MIVAETYVGLMTDPAHLGFEITLEALTGLVVYPLFRRARRRWHNEIDAEHGVTHDRITDVWVK